MSNSRVPLALVLTLTFAGSAAAQYYNYNPRNTYGNPAPDITAEARRKGPCGDPWVTLALINVYGRADPAKCNVALYNGGRWNDFNQLMHAVAKAGQAGGGGAAPAIIKIDITAVRYDCSSANACRIFSKDGYKIGDAVNGSYRNSPIVKPDGQPLVGNDGGTIKAQLVGNDGAGLVSIASSGMVAAGSLNLNPSIPVLPKGNYAVLGATDFRSLVQRTKRQ